MFSHLRISTLTCNYSLTKRHGRIALLASGAKVPFQVWVPPSQNLAISLSKTITSQRFQPGRLQGYVSIFGDPLRINTDLLIQMY